MTALQNSPVESTAEPLQKTAIEVFVSYAKEDERLVRDITDELRKPFSILLKFFIDHRSIDDGDEWRKSIDDRLDSADILLIISTGQKRESHDFPGYEVGFFHRSIKARPTADGIKRQIIPLIIAGKTPSAVLEIQGVVIKREDIFNFQVAPGDLSSEAKFLQTLDDDNPFRKLLLHLRDIVTTMTKVRLSAYDLEDLDKNINECASRLYKKVFAHLQGRIYSESYPERKLIFRTALPPLPSDEDALLATSTVEFVGKSFELFGLPECPPNLTWPAFLGSINPTEIAALWREGIRALVSASINGMPTDNYYFMSSSQAGRSFRLFVSLRRMYYSGQKELHIYIVEMSPEKDYGDSKTTKLLKAISVGMKYRSLFLESGSPFSPEIVGFVLAKDLRAKVADLWSELQHLLADARQAKLDEPELLAIIYGGEKHAWLDQLVVVWVEAEANLGKIIHDVMTAQDDKCAAMKGAFMAALQHFCDKTEEMNREFTAKALRALEKEITQKFGDAPGDAPKPAKATVAAPTAA